MRHRLFYGLFLVVSIAGLTFLFHGRALAASLQLTWVDNSSDEDGFQIERKTGSAGTFSVIATTGANVTSYSDSGMADNTSYCYRVNAFNGAGNSPYSPETCATTQAAPIAAYTLTVSSQAGGAVTSSPAGINCGATCSAPFNSGTTVVLSAAPASGYSFSGWSGDADCLDGSVTINANKTCTATFAANTVTAPTATLTVNVVGEVTTVGTGKGSVTSNPAGINCGNTCSADFTNGTSVKLTATAASGSAFSGWSGAADCSDGVVSMTASKSCAAMFTVNGNRLNIAIRGRGRVTGSPGAIDCVTDCSAVFSKRTRVVLRAAAAPGSAFTGWSGDRACRNGVVKLKSSTSCIASFEQRPASIGLFNSATHEWHLKSSLAGANNGCDVDPCFNPWQKKRNFAPGSQWIPVVGDWNGSGADDFGIYLPSDDSNAGSQWYLDRNGNEKWNGCKRDQCVRSFGEQADLPVVGDWNGTGGAMVGVFRPSTGEWFLDLDDNGRFDGCGVDRCIPPFGQSGDLPVAGDWDASGTSKIGLFRPSTGEWFLDVNGNGQWDGTNGDQYIAGFGQSRRSPCGR